MSVVMQMRRMQVWNGVSVFWTILQAHADEQTYLRLRGIEEQYQPYVAPTQSRNANEQLLYSSFSQSCLLNEDYIQNFEKPLDVFATGTRQVARYVAHCASLIPALLTINGSTPMAVSILTTAPSLMTRMSLTVLVLIIVEPP